VPRRAHRRLGALAGAALAALVLTSWGSSPATSAAAAPLPAGRLPSPIAKMVCVAKTQQELTDVLGIQARVGARTWVDHRYSCPYRYPDGRFVLSVQEESSWKGTFSYYHALGRRLGVTRRLANLGQGAFQVRNGSVVVRKDWKVLLVDVTGLPPRFGVPPTGAADIAVTVADVVLGCWSGD
jgi:hypothetical protein